MVEPNRFHSRDTNLAPGGPRGGAPAPGLPPRALAQQQDDYKENQNHDKGRDGGAPRTRPTVAQYNRPGTAGRERELAGVGAAKVPAPWEIPQGRTAGLSVNEMVLGASASRGATGSPLKSGAHKQGAAAVSPAHQSADVASPAQELAASASAQRFISASSSSEASRAPTATPHERVELGPTSSASKALERPTSAVKRLPEARPSTAGRRRFSEVDSPALLDGRSSSGVGMHSALPAHSQPPRDHLLPNSSPDTTLARGPALAHGDAAADTDKRTPGWAVRPMSATQRTTSVPSPAHAAHTAHTHVHAPPQQRAHAPVPAGAVQQGMPARINDQGVNAEEGRHASNGSRAAPANAEPGGAGKLALGPGSLGPMVKSADMQSRSVKEMSNEQLQALARSITTEHVKGLQQPFSSFDFYTLGKTLGEGAYGKVKLAVHRMTGEKVAVKTFEKSKLTEAQAQKRVAREVRILKALIHPHIIRLYEVVEEPYRQLIMMEYSSGGDLCRYVRDNRRLNESEASRLFVQIVDGLAYCHACGIVHRDVKLDNLLLDAQRNIRIVDFGACPRACSAC